MTDVIIVGAGYGLPTDVAQRLIAHDIQVLDSLGIALDVVPEQKVFSIHARDWEEPHAIAVETLPPKNWYQRYAGRRGRAPRY